MFSLDTLNEQQRLIAMDTEGAKLVTAGAGSGKTRLLTHRICYLIAEKNVSPFNILAITFTNKATNEMKERISTMIPNSSGITIKTFHFLSPTRTWYAHFPLLVISYHKFRISSAVVSPHHFTELFALLRAASLPQLHNVRFLIFTVVPLQTVGISSVFVYRRQSNAFHVVCVPIVSRHIV